MGIMFEERYQSIWFAKLKHREIKSTKWACPRIRNQLDINNYFIMYYSWLLPFVYQDSPTYRWLTLEFLSMFSHIIGDYYRSEDEWEGSDMITFGFMNGEYNMSLKEWCAYF
jgi:hypothetical protein